VGNLGIRLFTLTICVAALVTVPTIPFAKAGEKRSVETEKTRKRTQRNGPSDFQSPASNDLRSPTLPTFPPPMYDDLDRKAGGGAGM
jgi:hypothetical protein